MPPATLTSGGKLQEANFHKAIETIKRFIRQLIEVSLETMLVAKREVLKPLTDRRYRKCLAIIRFSGFWNRRFFG